MSTYKHKIVYSTKQNYSAELGKYSAKRFVAYLRGNLELMDKIMKLYNNFDQLGLRALPDGLDFASPFVGSPLTHKDPLKTRKQ